MSGRVTPNFTYVVVFAIIITGFVVLCVLANLGDDMQDFDFDEWLNLAKSDPEAFELRRQQAVEELIIAAPSDRQHRLRGMQWRVDMERRKYKDPLVSCQKVFGMMWQSVYGDNGLLQVLTDLPQQQKVPSVRQTRAQVLAFETSQDGD